MCLQEYGNGLIQDTEDRIQDISWLIQDTEDRIQDISWLIQDIRVVVQDTSLVDQDISRMNMALRALVDGE